MLEFPSIVSQCPTSENVFPKWTHISGHTASIHSPCNEVGNQGSVCTGCPRFKNQFRRFSWCAKTKATYPSKLNSHGFMFHIISISSVVVLKTISNEHFHLEPKSVWFRGTISRASCWISQNKTSMYIFFIFNIHIHTIILSWKQKVMYIRQQTQAFCLEMRDWEAETVSHLLLKYSF